jgi:hypothetical protein
MVVNISFVFVSFVAMFVYVGDYAFFQDPLSGLGFTHVDGQSNQIASLLFNSSMFLVGLSVIAIFFALYPYFKASLTLQWFSIAGSIFACFSGIAMCGAALTPGDINYDAHIAFAPFTFLFGFLMVLFYAIAIFLHQTFPPRYGIALVIYEVFALLSILVILLGTTNVTLEGEMLQITAQKVGIYAENVILVLLAYGGWTQLARE